MDQQIVVDRLNDLMELEARSFLRRLREAQSFVEWADADAVPVLERVVADEHEHQRQLSEAIVQLGEVPRPPILDMRGAGVHYVGMRHLLPAAIAEKRERIAAYGQAAAQLASVGQVSGLIAGMLARHQAHLEQLEALAERFAAAPADPPEPAIQGDDA